MKVTKMTIVLTFYNPYFSHFGNEEGGVNQKGMVLLTHTYPQISGQSTKQLYEIAFLKILHYCRNCTHMYTGRGIFICANVCIHSI